MLSDTWLWVITVAPLALLIGVLHICSWWALRGKRKPTSEKMLRPPGESLRKQIDELNEGFVFRLLDICAFSTTLLLFFAAWPFCGSLGRKVALLADATLWLAFLFFLAWKVVDQVRLCRNLNLGYNGERYVGEFLNQLMLDGCHVFHDYPADPKWNIDHIIVGPTGVFAVETKARRKNTAVGDAKAHAVVYDGNSLTFPTGKDSEMIEQATRNASWLARDLSKAIGEPVTVKAILTLPGWWVERKAKNEVAVLNPKEIRSHILSGKQGTLAPEKIKRIIYQLDQKCRDVEF